ncbi:hypothetical protein [Niabella sp.]|uniref:RCC1 domain-containing protein n=1 Tax=Niabella sp. TaxID=1962976 RepID=UPI00262CF02E|nr:hypothetical protein [Niabella sp.]
MKQCLFICTLALAVFSSYAQSAAENWIATYLSNAKPTHVMVLSDGSLMTWEAGGTPEKVAGIRDAVQVSAGTEHVLVLDKSGTVWAMGKNEYYQLGNPDLSDKGIRESAALVRVAGLKNVTAISAYRNSSYALQSDGTVWAWGNGNNGMSGDGGKLVSGLYGAGAAGKKSPVPVIGLDHVKAIAGAMALKEDGTVWTWGDGVNGRLGTGITQSTSTPAQIAGLKNVVAVSASIDGGFALHQDGTVSAWGNNYKGQLGNGVPSADLYQDSKFVKSPVPVKVIKLPNVKQISANASILALCKDGTVMGWGWGNIYALGPLGGDVTSTPVRVHSLSGVKAVKAGNGLGFALLNDGTLIGWGAQMAATGLYRQSKTIVQISKLGKLAPR